MGKTEYRFASKEDGDQELLYRSGTMTPYCADTKRLREKHFRSLMFLHDVACSIIAGGYVVSSTTLDSHNEFPLAPALGQIILVARSFPRPSQVVLSCFRRSKAVLLNIAIIDVEAAKIMFKILIRKLASSFTSSKHFNILSF